MIFGYDVIHGFRTIFPIPLAQAASWNPSAVERSCSVAAAECNASGVDWTFSPMIDIARDGRWGRISEGYGEDPYAASVYCTSAVRGYQGDDLSAKGTVAACLKHYVGYGRLRRAVIMSRLKFRVRAFGIHICRLLRQV